MEPDAPRVNEQWTNPVQGLTVTVTNTMVEGYVGFTREEPLDGFDAPLTVPGWEPLPAFLRDFTPTKGT